MSRKGLGKGLGALIPEVEVTERDQIHEIEVTRIRPNPRQPRKHFDTEKLEELAQSIREHGVIQPLVVRPHGEGYEVVAGERRWRASQLAGQDRVPAVIRDLSDAKMMEIALIENLQREDLNPLEGAEAYRVLLDEYQMTQDDLARRVGKSRPQITNTLRLLSLSPAVRQEVAAGHVSVGHAKVLLGLEDGAVQNKWAARVARDGLSVRQLEEALQHDEKEQAGKTRRAKAPREADLLVVEDQLRQHLGTPVKITPGSPRGHLLISFFGEADLTRLVEIILGRAQADTTPVKRNFHI